LKWEIDYPREHGLVRTDHPQSFDVIHLGEHFDLGLAMSLADPTHITFTAYWDDENGSHQTKRMINL
jgi:hypothetical protein